MAIREDLVASAVAFLHDPSVSSSPIESRIAFLRSKNLTQEEIDAALARAGAEPSTASYASYNAPPLQSAPPAYGPYQASPWQQPPPVPQRDWRDWFIMATVLSGVGYGAYVLAKRYVYPIIAPPTPPQLEQDKAAIDASFDRAFALLDQLSKDTEQLKTSEQARTERLDSAISDFESVINELTVARTKREQEARRLDDEIRALREMIPKAIEGQREATDNRLKDLNTEMKSLKTLMGQRMNTGTSAAPAATPMSYRTLPAVNGAGTTTTVPAAALTNGMSSSAATAEETNGSAAGRPLPSFKSGAPAGIPSWQLAAKSSSPTPEASASTASSGSGSTPKEPAT